MLVNVFRSRESTLISCRFMLNAFHVDDLRRVPAAAAAGSSGVTGFMGVVAPPPSDEPVSNASEAGEGARDEFLLPTLVDAFWGLDDNCGCCSANYTGNVTTTGIHRTRIIVSL